MDYRNSELFDDSFSIIYGHRMGNGEMFSDIHKYKDGNFFNEHRDGVLKMRNVEKHLEIIAYAEIKADNWDIYNVERSRKRNDVISALIRDAEYSADYDMQVSDVFVLLSTCNGSKKNVRDVLLVRVINTVSN